MDSLRFIHTADWQIGRTFRFADEVTLGVLADARIEAVGAIGTLARAEGIGTVLVAGDVYDVERPSERTLRQPVERMAAFPEVSWHLIPGNHDPHRPGGAFERLLRSPLPANVVAHVREAPVRIGGSAWLLPAILRERHASFDPTDAFDAMATPEGAMRIGLAHGSVRGFGETGENGHNRIAPDRAARSGLAYLALGDWHGAQEAGRATWYAGTPETDDFAVGGGGGGEVLIVRVEGPASSVERRRVGRFAWHRVEERLFDRAGVEALAMRLRGLEPSLDRALVQLSVSGALSLAEMGLFEDAVENGLGAATRLLRVERSGLSIRPELADLEALEAGPVRLAAEKLARIAQGDGAKGGDPVAADALRRLVFLAGREGAGA